MCSYFVGRDVGARTHTEGTIRSRMCVSTGAGPGRPVSRRRIRLDLLALASGEVVLLDF
jgi:hypothetical protein